MTNTVVVTISHRTNAKKLADKVAAMLPGSSIKQLPRTVSKWYPRYEVRAQNVSPVDFQIVSTYARTTPDDITVKLF